MILVQTQGHSPANRSVFQSRPLQKAHPKKHTELCVLERLPNTPPIQFLEKHAFSCCFSTNSLRACILVGTTIRQCFAASRRSSRPSAAQVVAMGHASPDILSVPPSRRLCLSHSQSHAKTLAQAPSCYGYMLVFVSVCVCRWRDWDQSSVSSMVTEVFPSMQT